MSGLDNREKAHENKFAHDEEMTFKIKAGASKLLGVWAANLMNKNENESIDYAASLLDNHIFSSKDQLPEAVLKDLKARGVDISLEQVQQKFAQYIQQVSHKLLGDPQ